MTFDLQRILQSKRKYRNTLAVRPIAEKLRMLDALRERAIALGHGALPANVVREERTLYRPQKPA